MLEPPETTQMAETKCSEDFHSHDQALWEVDLTRHGAAMGEWCIASLTFNAEQGEVLVGLSTGALYCLQTSGSDCGNVEEVLSCPSAFTRPALANSTGKAWYP